MTDGGIEVSQAISMHQPWASLLVYGIKRIEGRSWPTSFSGRLWIHATARVATPAVIKETEDSYREVWSMEAAEPTFPVDYPTSALLGCVEVIDCLKAECIEAWPGLPESVKAEVGSPFGFLCDNPKRLVVPQRMSGAQKIWSFPAKIGRTLEPALRPAAQVGNEPWTWTNFNMPESLRKANLPRSMNSNKWANQYGSPKCQRLKTGSPSNGQWNLAPKPKYPTVASSANREDVSQAPEWEQHKTACHSSRAAAADGQQDGTLPNAEAERRVDAPARP